MDQCAFNALHVDTRGRSLYYIRAKGARSLALLATRQTCKPQRLSLIGYAPNWISYVPPSWSTWRVQKHKRGGFMLLIYDYEKQHFAPWLLKSNILVWLVNAKNLAKAPSSMGGNWRASRRIIIIKWLQLLFFPSAYSSQLQCSAAAHVAAVKQP